MSGAETLFVGSAALLVSTLWALMAVAWRVAP